MVKIDLEKYKEDIAAVSANIQAHTPEHLGVVIDPSGELLKKEDTVSELFEKVLSIIK